MKNPNEMSIKELRDEILELVDKEDQKSINRVEVLRRELNKRYEGVPLPSIEESEDDGSIIVGVILGFFLSIVGAIMALLIDKKRTKTGALYGLIVEIGLGLIIAAIILIFQQFNR